MMNKESICRNCFHSYVCEQFNENKDDNNTKCHFANDHYIPTADVVPKSEVEKLSIELLHAKEDYGDLVAEFIGAGKKIEKLEKELADMLVSEFTDVSVSMERLYRIRTEHPICKAIKVKVAREIFEDFTRNKVCTNEEDFRVLTELKKKYIGE